MMDWYKVITVMSVHTLPAYWPHPQLSCFWVQTYGVRSYNKSRKLVDKTFLRQHCIKLFQVMRSGIIHCEKTAVPVNHLDL